jgi:hypothetical protein
MKFFSILISLLSLIGFEATPAINTVPAPPPPVPVTVVEEVNTVEPSADMDAALLARCLTANEIKLYGSYTCGHCNNQKEMFGNAIEYVTYVECNSNHEDADVAACDEAGIRAYPTWVLPDGEQLVGTRQLEDLARETGCQK